MKAVNYYVVVDKIKNEEKTIAGLIVTENIDEDNRYNKAKVVSVGHLVEGIKEKDIVYYDKHAGHGIEWNDEVYHVINLGDVVIVE